MKIFLGWLIFRVFGEAFQYDSPLEIVLMIVGLLVALFAVVFVVVLVKQWLARPTKAQREQEGINQMFDQMVKDWDKNK